MGFLDDIVGRVKNEASWKVSQGISNATSKIFDRKKKVPGEIDKCPKCRKKIEAIGLKFCPSCGATLVATCSKCSLDFPLETKFCTQCGGKLKGNPEEEK